MWLSSPKPFLASVRKWTYGSGWVWGCTTAALGVLTGVWVLGLGGSVWGGGSSINAAVWVSSSGNGMVLLVVAHWIDVCMLPSMPTSKPAQSCVFPQASLPSIAHCMRTSLEMAHIQASPMPSGLTPGCLSRATRRPWRMARYDAHGGAVFASQSAHSTSSSQSSAEALPCLRS